MSFPPPLPITALWHSTAALFSPAHALGPLHHRLQVVLHHRAAATCSLPYLPTRLSPRARLPAHFLLPPPASLLLCSLITPFSARAATFPPFEMAFFAKDTSNLTATIRFAGAQSQNIRSIRAFSAHHSQWQSPASHLPALHDYRRKNEKCRAPSTHGRAVYCPCDTCGTAKCPTVDIGGNMQHPHN